MKGLDGIGGTADDVLVEGNPAAPISLANAVRTGRQFLIDIAHNAVPVGDRWQSGDAQSAANSGRRYRCWRCDTGAWHL